MVTIINDALRPTILILDCTITPEIGSRSLPLETHILFCSDMLSVMPVLQQSVLVLLKHGGVSLLICFNFLVVGEEEQCF